MYFAILFPSAFQSHYTFPFHSILYRKGYSLLNLLLYFHLISCFTSLSHLIATKDSYNISLTFLLQEKYDRGKEKGNIQERVREK